MSDNGCQPTSVSFMKACQIMGVNQAFTSYSNPKGYADTEWFMRTLKEEQVWVNEFTSPVASWKPWTAGSMATTPNICTRLSATSRRKHSRQNTLPARLT